MTTGGGRGGDREHYRYECQFCDGDYKGDLEKQIKYLQEDVEDQTYRNPDEFTDFVVHVLRLNKPIETVREIEVPEGMCVVFLCLFWLFSG